MQKQSDLDQLKLVMAKEQMTFETLAERTGVPKLHLIHLLEGTCEFKASEIIAISNALNLNDTQKIKIFCR